MYYVPHMTITHSDPETKQFAKDFAAQLTSGVIVCLHGDLGAGKTTFVKGLAEGLGIKEDITSPTFTLMNVYDIHNAKLAVQKLIHIDTYRLKDELELMEIGVEDYLGQPGTATLVEWPEKIAGLLQNKKVINIYIDHQGKDRRAIAVR